MMDLGGIKALFECPHCIEPPKNPSHHATAYGYL